MRSVRGKLAVLLIGSALASGGWGAVLPFIYVDIADTRQLGGLAAAATFVAFAIGSLLAAPGAGLAADRVRPASVAALARLAMAVTVLGLGLASSAVTVWLFAALLGAAVAYSQPAISVMLLAAAPPERRRDVFAWQFISLNLALAAGGFVGGQLIDLTTRTGAERVYYFAAAMAAISGAAVHAAARHIPVAATATAEAGDQPVGYRALLANPSLRLLLGVTVLITLACYAQYESGLPAFALDAVHVSPKVIGVGVAVNAILVAALTAPVVRLTRHRTPTNLLAACAGIWIGCWVVVAVPLFVGGYGSTALVVGFAAIAVGETMLAPVLSPLAASLAPEGAAGRTLAAVAGAQTLACAVGPALSGVLMALGVPLAFIVLQLSCCVGAIVLARRLGRHMATVGRPLSRSADEPAPAVHSG